jgi:hypothetical protein
LRRYPEKILDDVTIKNAVLITLCQPPRSKNVIKAILKGFNDPYASFSKGEISNLTERILNFSTECQTKLFIFDEVQELYNRDAKKIMHEATNVLKYLIKQTEKTFVWFGLEGVSEKILDVNTQLKGLFKTPIAISAFEWDLKSEDTIKEFIKFLELVENSLPLKENSNLTSEEIAWRCFAASYGRIGYLMSILRGAAHIALNNNSESITMGMLSHSFEKNSSLSIENPFSGKPPRYPLPTLAPDNVY